MTQRTRACTLVSRYTALAATTGAIPLPAASGAIVAENAALIGHISAVYGLPISLEAIASSLGGAALLNLAGRALFVEGMRALNMIGGGVASVLVSGLGATTAGVQTWVIGHLTIAIAENGGNPLPQPQAAEVVASAASTFSSRDHAPDESVPSTANRTAR